MRLSFNLICFALILWSCEDRRNFDVDNFEKEVVLNSIISTDSSWNVQLSYTKSIFDQEDFSIIDEADVRVLNLTNGQSFYLDKKQTGLYARELNPVEGHEYALSINIPGYDEIHARTYVPSVLEVDVVSNFIRDNDGKENIEIDLEITDNPNEENYYVWELLEVDLNRFSANASSSSPVSTIIEEEASVDAQDDSEDVPNDGNPDSATNALLSPNNIFSFLTEDDSDNRYQKKDYNSLSFLSESDVRAGKIANRLILDGKILTNHTDEGEEANSNLNKTPLFELKVMAVSSDLYEYLKSYELYRNNVIKNTSISDPVIIYSNIENGLGIFGGYNLKSFYIF